MISSTNPVKTLKQDGKITIATGRSRHELEWKNREMLWSQLLEKLSQTTRTRETLAEFDKMTKAQQDGIKDVGGFVGGTLKGGRRTGPNVGWRHVLTLDADFAGTDFPTLVDLMLGSNAYAIYSTHKHRPGKPRLRLVIPTSRGVTPDEYPAITRRIAADIGIDLFDDTTYQPHRLMYWPSTSADGEYVFLYNDASWLDPDEVLARYPDWRDQSFWPESSRANKERKRLAEKQGDPHEKPGIVGAFCRTYSIPEAIETFLAGVYEPCAMEGRYTYTQGTAAAGLVLYEDKFAYSHHGTDPISGKLVNAFDLVRLHKFGMQDDEAEPGTPVTKLPSYKAMVRLAAEDEQVKLTQGKETLASAGMDFKDDDTDWLKQLDRHHKTGEIKPTRSNIRLILEHDPQLAGLFATDDFAHRICLMHDLPWRPTERGVFWGDNDDKALRYHMETYYGIEAPTKIADEVSNVAEKNAFHPIREYLGKLSWDGIPRLDTLLIDYLGAEDTPYLRAVTRKAFLAAVARVFVPGIKFDNMLVMVGPQGVGKSYILKLLAKHWHSDSLTTVQGKEAYEQLQGAWIVELAELSALRKAEAEAIKNFISKQEDAYRVAYGRQISVFPRQCVFFGTTNDLDFLKDKTGNRRFWPVEVGVRERKLNLWQDMTELFIDQVWAEAADAWHGGETLYIGADMEREAVLVQNKHTEESPLAGLVREYLNRLLPENWEQLDLGARRSFLHNRDFDEAAKGTVRRERVCVPEVWAELLEGDMKRLSKLQAIEINDILRRSPGWKAYKNGEGRLRFGPIYGTQRAYIREEEIDFLS
jgi:predicted P-loop ATPase